MIVMYFRSQHFIVSYAPYYIKRQNYPLVWKILPPRNNYNLN